MKTIAFQRLISFLLTERTVKSYEGLSKKQFQLMDSPSGQTGRCDFIGEDQWGECTNIFQSHAEAKHLFQNLFAITSLKEIEEKYGVQIEPNSIPNAQEMMWREYEVNTKAKIKEEIEKKLKKSYPYPKNFYSAKGTLIVGIFDPSFSGFKRDIEISSHYLNALANDIHPLFKYSSFSNILLVDAMSPFDQEPENLTYMLQSL